MTAHTPDEGVVPETPRWHYRFDNYRRAFGLLRAAIETVETRDLSQLEQEGLIQRFEYTWELAWKCLKDFLEAEGIVFATITPRAVLRAALAAGVIERGEDWMAALDARNRMSHTYNFQIFQEVIEQIRVRYLHLFDALHERLLAERLAGFDHV